MGDLEGKVLFAISHTGDSAYGVSIWETIRARTGEDPPMGAIYSTLDRLEKKGYVESSWSEPTPERGGRRKRLFRMTGLGERSLEEYDRRFRQIREGWRAATQMG